MALKKLCAKCEKIIDMGQRYCNECQEKADKSKKKRDKKYSREHRRFRTDKEEQLFYVSKRWIQTRDRIKSRDNGLCLMCLDMNQIGYYEVVHHIIELKEDKSKAYDKDNLLCLCGKCHRYVHREYEKSEREKKSIQELLRDLIKEDEDMEEH